MSTEMEALVCDLLEDLREEPAALAAVGDVHSGTESLLLRACRELRFVERHARQAIAIVLAAREIHELTAFWNRIAGFVVPALVGWIAIAVLHALVGHKVFCGVQFWSSCTIPVLSRCGIFFRVMCQLF